MENIKNINFHDSVLDVIIIEYKNNRIILNITEAISSKSKRIVINEFTNIIVPRHFPWGESFQINEIFVDEVILIQLQSGDEISINGKIEKIEYQ
jgi:hypothetical protein